MFKTVATAAKELSVESYVVGGYVRDLMLGRACKDIDFVCVGDGIALAHKVASLIKPSPEVHIFRNYGTAMLRHEEWELEFVGARKESYTRHSRNPKVEQGTLEDDQKRRDFTINAFAISLNDESYGDLLDPFGGLNDLKNKIIRTPTDPEKTFSDDPLRMMRAIRFASQLNFDIEPITFEAIQKNKERITIVSKERISAELNKIILSEKPSYGFKLLYHSGLLSIIFPELAALQGVETIDNKSHKDNFYHTLQVLDNVAKESDSLWLRWAALLHDIAKPATKRFDPKVGWTFHGHEEIGARMVPKIFSRLRLPQNEHMRKVVNLVRLHLRPIALVSDHVTDSAIRRLLFEAGDDYEDLMILCRADITSKNNSKVERYLANFKKVEQKITDVEQRDMLRNFQPVLTGNDIMNLFGLSPGKKVGDIKTALREAILEGEINNTMEAAQDFVIRFAKKMYNLDPVKKTS
ncbi:MAG: CCA tRNA nucleotidyltransferase [Cytophagaceae bacterium]|nr:CCA tRNA nucleotidyltransferase [Cytophagaceae bacterium]MDW8456218.1 HD domain-containing protein [Cytophagaceae bacterium]